MCVIRCCRDMSLETKKAKLNMLPKEEHGTLWEAEKNYSRKFQSWVGGTLRLNSASTSSLKKARDDGRLHTEMLQRRSVMKNDKYCK